MNKQENHGAIGLQFSLPSSVLLKQGGVEEAACYLISLNSKV